MTNRRTVLIGAGAVVLAGAGVLVWRGQGNAASGPFAVSLTPEEWRERLTDAEFAVLREAGTEPPYSSPLNALEETGTYVCAGCENRVYLSETKYDSGTGWPSFWDSIAGATGTRADYKLILPRTEVHCARCGGHLGHIFDDGPSPTGKRHCLNGVALDFVAA